MLPEIKLTISQNDKLIQTISKTTEKEHLAKSLQEFQLEANAALTKMIEDLGDIHGGGDCYMDGDDDEDEEDEDKHGLESHSEGQNGQSKCKKKKRG